MVHWPVAWLPWVRGACRVQPILWCGESAHADTPTRFCLRRHTSGRSDNLELKGCPRLLKFPVLLFLLAILNRRRQLPRLHRSSRHRLPRCRHRLALFLRLNRCQHRLRSRGIVQCRPILGEPNGFNRPARTSADRFYPSVTIASSMSRFSSSENDNVRACSRPAGDIFFQVFRNISIILPRSVLAIRSAS
jgi:hypothetical protein